MEISHVAMAALGSTAPTPTPSASSDLVAERFNAMMSAAAKAPEGSVSSSASSWTAATAEPAGTLGGHILAGLKSVSTDYADKWRNVTVGLNNMIDSPSAGNMLKVQSELLQVSVQYELVGKAISRSTQNIDTLVRMS